MRRSVYVHQRTGEYRKYWHAAADSIGADFIDLSDGIWEVRRGGMVTHIANDLVGLDDPATLAVAGDKAVCYRLASDLGIPVPKHRVMDVRQLRSAWRWMAADGRPFVVKPRRNTSSGIGVSIGVTSRREAVVAFATAALRDRQVIVERMIGGETCRLLYLGGTLIHAVRRRGIRLKGDGTATIRSLLADMHLGHLIEDRVTNLTLAAQGLSLTDVPPDRNTVVVRALPDGEGSTRELRTVYDEDISALIAPALGAELASLVAAIGSEWAGVDIITSDLSRTLADSGGAMLEVNTTPGLHHHCAISSDAGPCRLAVLVLERALLRAEQKQVQLAG